jgi:hypothetical protein
MDALIGNSDRHHENWASFMLPRVVDSPRAMTTLPRWVASFATRHVPSASREPIEIARSSDTRRVHRRPSTPAPTTLSRSARSTRSVPRHTSGPMLVGSGWPGWRTWGRMRLSASWTLSQQS